MDLRIHNGSNININTYISIEDTPTVKEEIDEIDSKAESSLKLKNVLNGVKSCTYTEHVEVYLPQYDESEVNGSNAIEHKSNISEITEKCEVNANEVKEVFDETEIIGNGAGKSGTVNEIEMKKPSILMKRKLYKCDMCQKELSCTSSLRRHIKFVHKDSFPNSDVNTTLDVNLEEPCFSEQLEKLGEQQQESQEDDTKIYKKIKTDNDPNLSHHVVMDEQNEYECLYCGEKYDNKNVYMTHLSWHEAYQPYCCDICVKWFSEKDEFDSHMAHHGAYPDEQYTCQYCYKYFVSSSEFRKHIEKHFDENRETEINDTLFDNFGVEDGSELIFQNLTNVSATYSYEDSIDLLNDPGLNDDEKGMNEDDELAETSLYKSIDQEVLLLDENNEENKLVSVTDTDVQNEHSRQYLDTIDLINDSDLSDDERVMTGPTSETSSLNQILRENVGKIIDSNEMEGLKFNCCSKPDGFSDGFISSDKKVTKSLSGYQLFTKICFKNGKLNNLHPTEKISEISKIWNALTDTEKKKYSDEARKLTAKNSLLEAALTNFDTSDVALNSNEQITDVNGYALTGYELFTKMYYTNDRLCHLTSEGKNRELSKMWEFLSESEKEAYFVLAQQCSKEIDISSDSSKPTNGYQLFSKICFRNGGLDNIPPNERIFEVCKRWNLLTELEKNEYSDHAKLYETEKSNKNGISVVPNFKKVTESHKQENPLSGYQIFVKTCFASNMLSHVSPCEKLHKIAEMWSALSELEKEQYKNQAKQYNSSRMSSLSNNKRAAVKHISGYQLFTRIFLRNDRLGNIKPTERMSEVSKRWRALTDVEKKEYSDKAEQFYLNAIAEQCSSESETPPNNTNVGSAEYMVSNSPNVTVKSANNSPEKQTPVSGFQYYVKTVFATDTFNHLPPQARMRKISELWRALSPTAKKKYTLEAKQLRSSDNKKRPVKCTFSGYKLFTMLCFKNHKLDNFAPNEKICEVSKRWKLLTESEKKAYSDQAKAVRDENRTMKSVLSDYENSMNIACNSYDVQVTNNKEPSPKSPDYQLFNSTLASGEDSHSIGHFRTVNEVLEQWDALSDTERKKYATQTEQNEECSTSSCDRLFTENGIESKLNLNQDTDIINLSSDAETQKTDMNTVIEVKSEHFCESVINMEMVNENERINLHDNDIESKNDAN